MIQPQTKIIGNAEKAYHMLGNENLWSVAVRCHQLLREAGVPHLIAGGAGYRQHPPNTSRLCRRRGTDRNPEPRQFLRRVFGQVTPIDIPETGSERQGRIVIPG